MREVCISPTISSCRGGEKHRNVTFSGGAIPQSEGIYRYIPYNIHDGPRACEGRNTHRSMSLHAKGNLSRRLGALIGGTPLIAYHSVRLFRSSLSIPLIASCADYHSAYSAYRCPFRPTAHAADESSHIIAFLYFSVRSPSNTSVHEQAKPQRTHSIAHIAAECAPNERANKRTNN